VRGHGRNARRFKQHLAAYLPLRDAGRLVACMLVFSAPIPLSTVLVYFRRFFGRRFFAVGAGCCPSFRCDFKPFAPALRATRLPPNPPGSISYCSSTSTPCCTLLPVVPATYTELRLILYATLLHDGTTDVPTEHKTHGHYDCTFLPLPALPLQRRAARPAGISHYAWRRAVAR